MNPRSIISLALLSVILAGCGSEGGAADSTTDGPDQEAASAAVGDTQSEARYEEFLAQLTPVNGGYQFEGDIFITEEIGPRAFWNRFMAGGPSNSAMPAAAPSAPGRAVAAAGAETGQLGTSQQGLATWDPADERGGNEPRTELTFCIRRSGDFSLTPTEAAIVARRMVEASALWNAQTGRTFRYVGTEDGDCSGTNERVFFHVRLTTPEETGFAARSWFPGDPRSARALLIKKSAISDTDAFRGLMLHEFGHALGFIHEHVFRPEGGCETTGVNETTRRTRYDAASIMHYTSCGGTNNTALSIYDRLGAQCAYFGNCEWSRVQSPGASDIGMGGGEIWIAGDDGIPYRYDNFTRTFEKMPGENVVNITVDSSGVPWVTITNRDIYRWNGSSWKKMPGQALDIAAGGGKVWCIGTDRQTYEFNDATGRWVLNSRRVDNNRIAVDSTGAPWVTTTARSILKKEVGDSWTQQAGKGRDIGAGNNGSIWITGDSDVNGGSPIYQYTPGLGPLQQWTRVTGAALRIAVDDRGTPWVTTSTHQVYQNLWE
jgi:hypothetical protein